MFDQVSRENSDPWCSLRDLISFGSLVGSILVQYGPNQGSELFGLYLFIAYAAGFPISFSMIASNVAGFTKKSVASSMVFMAYTAGNIIGPFLFFADEAPEYTVSCRKPIAKNRYANCKNRVASWPPLFVLGRRYSLCWL